MDLQYFLDGYAPLNLVSYDRNNTVLAAHNVDNTPFIIMVRIKPRTYVAVTNFDDPGIASNEFYIIENQHEYYIHQDYDQLEMICTKAIEWTIITKNAIRTTDDYYSIVDNANTHMQQIYDQYFHDLNIVLMVVTMLLIAYPNY
jgi:hypothetical protein